MILDRIAKVMRNRHPNWTAITTATITLAGAFASVGCGYPYAVIRGATSEQVKLIVDSPEVRRLISEESAREEQVRRSLLQDKTPEQKRQWVKDEVEHPEHYTSGRKEFLASMESQPTVAVHGQANSNKLEWSPARCTMHPYHTMYFVKVRVTKGPDQGIEGWICSAKIDYYDGF